MIRVERGDGGEVLDEAAEERGQGGGTRRTDAQGNGEEDSRQQMGGQEEGEGEEGMHEDKESEEGAAAGPPGPLLRVGRPPEGERGSGHSVPVDMRRQ